MAILEELLTEQEIKKIEDCNGVLFDVGLHKDIRFMTMQEFTWIAFILIETECKGRIHECVLSAKAIEILTDRAIQKNIDIY